MRKRAKAGISSGPNLFDLMPTRKVGWETSKEGKVVLLVPKFSKPWVVRWIVPLLAKPVFRLQLDEVGSFVWNQLDGATTVGEVAARMRDVYGGEFDPQCDRLAMFVQKFLRDNLLVLPGETVPRSS